MILLVMLETHIGVAVVDHVSFFELFIRIKHARDHVYVTPGAKDCTKHHHYVLTL